MREERGERKRGREESEEREKRKKRRGRKRREREREERGEERREKRRREEKRRRGRDGVGGRETERQRPSVDIFFLLLFIAVAAWFVCMRFCQHCPRAGGERKDRQ